MLKKLRAQQIIIDLPSEEGATWIRAVIQTIYKDEPTYETVQVVDRTGFVHREISNVATEMQTVFDPVTQQNISVSGVGCALLIKKFITTWIANDNNGEINSLDDIIVKE